jgi:hypothetical protein
MNPVYKIGISPLDLVTENKTVRIRSNKILIQNKSNYKVYLFRMFTLVPGQIIEMGTENDFGILHCDMEIHFDTSLFDPAEADIKRVEILQMNTIGGETAWNGTPEKTDVPGLVFKTLTDLNGNA